MAKIETYALYFNQIYKTMLQNLKCPRISLKTLNLNCHLHCDVTVLYTILSAALFSKRLKDIILEIILNKTSLWVTGPLKFNSDKN